MSSDQSLDQRYPGEERTVDDPAESPVLLHVWVVDPEREGVAADGLKRMLREVATGPGFVSARLLESTDRHSIAAVVEMRTIEDRQRLEELPVVRDTLHHLDGTFNLLVSLYHEVETDVA